MGRSVTTNLQGRSFSVGDVAYLLGLTRETIQNWCKKGKIPHYTLPNGFRRVMREQLVQFIAEKIGGELPLPPGLEDEVAIAKARIAQCKTPDLTHGKADSSSKSEESDES